MSYNIESIKNNKKRIDTTLPKETVQHIKKNGWKVNQLIQLGILFKEGSKQLTDRIHQNEINIKFLEEDVAQLKRQVEDLITSKVLENAIKQPIMNCRENIIERTAREYTER